ncbi:hypothetical protein BDZ89DRAFT_1080847 [Hymenopellis radicata]|nr:hypothetical protein BDZ89DRAFT_1080847 [Hymenopellis radicata]
MGRRRCGEQQVSMVTGRSPLGVDASLLSVFVVPNKAASLFSTPTYIAMKPLNLKKIQKYAAKHPPIIANAFTILSHFHCCCDGKDDIQAASTSAADSSADNSLDPEEDWEDLELARKRYQGVSVKIQPFLDFGAYIQEAEFDSQYHDAVIGDCRRCGQPEKAIFRCQQCRTRPVCSSCIVQCHQHCHFHRIQRWNLQFFGVASLHDLGLVFNLGHDGDKCPASENCSNHNSCRRSSIIHLSAVASDPRGPKNRHHLRSLENFNIHANTSKKSAYDYCYALQRLTDAVEPDKVSDCYRSFMRAIRVKRRLEYRRRSGQEQGIDAFITHRRPGSMSIYCPAFWEAKECDAHKYTKFEQNDGTFNAPRLKKKEDPDDEAITAGLSYMAEEKEYQAYLDRCEGEEPDANTCARLRAMKLQSLLKFVNLIVSGIVGTTCSRHVFFEDNSVVDMYGGERFAYATRSLFGTLRYQLHQRWIRWAYDIWCQFVKNLSKRLFEDGKSLIGRLKGGIPPLHVLGHISLCRTLYGYSHQKNVGKTCPETVETPWAATRICGGSVKHQNHGQRQDSLNAAFDDWNYNKLIKLACSISKAYVKAKKTHSRLRHEFDLASKAISHDLRAKWEREYAEPLPEADDNHIVDRFEVNFKGIDVPTMQQFMKDQLERERAEALSKTPTPGFADGLRELLEEGVRLDHDQKVVSLLAEAEDDEWDDRDALDTTRERLYAAICTFMDRLSPAKRHDSRYNLQYATEVEYGLRKVQAHEILTEIRGLIILQVENLRAKKEHLHGQGATTRAHRILKRFEREKKEAMIRYNFGKDATKVAQPGEARMGDSWLWSVSKPGGLTEEDEQDWYLEIVVRRVKWFREKDECEHWREETEILEAERPRVETHHEKTATVWAKIANKAETPGRKAYAFRQRASHMRWRDRMVTEWKEALAKVKRNEEVMQKKREREAEMESADIERERRAEEMAKAESSARGGTNRRNMRIDHELEQQAARSKKSQAKRKRVPVDDDEEDSDDSEEEVHEADHGDDDETGRPRPKKKARASGSPTKGKGKAPGAGSSRGRGGRGRGGRGRGGRGRGTRGKARGTH